MGEKLSRILTDYDLDGYGRMLRKTYKQFGDLDVGDKLLEQIVTRSIDKSELYRQLTNGAGKGKPHVSKYIDDIHDGRIRAGNSSRRKGYK